NGAAAATEACCGRSIRSVASASDDIDICRRALDAHAHFRERAIVIVWIIEHRDDLFRDIVLRRRYIKVRTEAEDRGTVCQDLLVVARTVLHCAPYDV